MSALELLIDDQLLEICQEIVAEDKTLKEWSQEASEDYFETPDYKGGFNKSERTFYFSYYDDRNQEHHFELTLREVREIVSGKKIHVSIKPAEYYPARSFGS